MDDNTSLKIMALLKDMLDAIAINDLEIKKLKKDLKKIESKINRLR